MAGLSFLKRMPQRNVLRTMAIRAYQRSTAASQEYHSFPTAFYRHIINDTVLSGLHGFSRKG